MSVFEVLRTGPGPSSTHTSGPLAAARRFVHELAADGAIAATARVAVELYGGIACTGREHGADRALIAGLEGLSNDRCDAATLTACSARVQSAGSLALGGRHRILFDPPRDIGFRVDRALAHDGNVMRFAAFDAAGAPLADRLYCSVGDGQVLALGESLDNRPAPRVPYPFDSVESLLRQWRATGKKIADVALANELALRSPGEMRTALIEMGRAMRAAVDRGLAAGGVLPGGGTKQAAERAAGLRPDATPAQWCSVYATAVGEENACGARIVAAPSHAAAGPVAALLYHVRKQDPMYGDDGVVAFLLTAGAIGGVLRSSGLRQVGCQSEIGVGAAMAAAGYAAALGASNVQTLRAAELALEPHFGLACDPVSGRVETPCIGRGASAAARAHLSAHIAVREPAPRLALDVLIRSMVESGRGLAGRYKTASLGGVAMNVADC